MRKPTARREDYLKLIYQLSKAGEVRGANIAEILDVSRPTVCVCLKRLAEAGDITMDEHHTVHLTQQGLAVAEATQEKHSFLVKLLCSIGVPNQIASNDACGIEHNLSPETYAALKQLYQERESARKAPFAIK